MSTPVAQRMRVGGLLVLAGLLLQLAAAAWFRPAMFLLSAGVGTPLVLLGAIAMTSAVRGAARADRSDARAGGNGDAPAR
jgi:hypothetical protein